MDERHLERMAGVEERPILMPHCQNCGYNLTGAPTNRCPECGEFWSIGQVKRQMASDQSQIHELRNINAMINAGFWSAVIGASLLAMGWLLGFMGGAAEELGKLFGAICAVIAFMLTMNVLRVFRVPPEIRNRISVKLDVFRVALSFSLIFFCVVLCVAL